MGAAQWNKKPYTNWSEKEALKVLDDSPWGQTQVFTSSGIEYSGPNREFDGSRAIDVGGNRVGLARHPEIAFRIRFLSAKPIRQAISRLVELKQQGRTDERMAAQLQAFINGDFSDYIVLSVVCDAPRPTVKLQDTKKLLAGLTTEQLKDNAYLSVNGDRRIPLAEYQPPREDGLGARFLFLRLMEGKPVVTPEAGEIRFHAELSKDFTLDRRYRIKDMMFEGRLEY